MWKRVGLRVNEGKTKVLALRRKKPTHMQRICVMSNYSFEVVNNFSYLGSLINEDINEDEEIRARLIAGNKTYFALSKLLRSC